MKTKHLFYSLALASAFTACTQEELVEAPVVKDNLANRPVAGVVEFSTEGVESRFNYEKANGFELGDVFGLYLMDQFVDGNAAYENNHKAEHFDANTTYWIYQNHWFGMYGFTNSIQSNYPFTYKNEGGQKVWKNDAKLVEGNYFAMFPQNEKALNRRELWHVIDPSVELKRVSSSTSSNLKYQNVENQFWLGYKQIYRDATASAEGTMAMNLDMTGVLVPLKFVINNNSNNDVIVDKISFKNNSRNALPTLAYVRPAGKDWVKYTAANDEFINCDAKAHYLYNEAATWTKQTVQNIVEWTVPGDQNIPYGLEGADAKKAYEYSFSYPADVTLKGNVNGGSLLTTYIAIPAMENYEQWKDLQVCIYGWQKDNSSATGWTYGMLSTTKSGDDDNYTFDLYTKLNEWTEQAEETNYYREISVKFSEFAWKTVNQSIVAGTSDMEKMVKSYLSQNSGDVELTIAPDRNGVEVTEEFVEFLEKDSQGKGRTIKLTFDGGRGGVVTFNDDNTMAINTITTETADGVIFDYINNIQLKNNAAQTVANYTISVPVKNNGTLTVLRGGVMSYVQNNGTMTISSNSNNIDGGAVTTLDNWGDLTLKCNSTVGTLNNNPAAKTVVDAYHKTGCVTATVTTLKNMKDDQCDGSCVAAELVAKSGILAVTNLTNDAKFTVETGGTVNVAAELINNDHKNQFGTYHGYTLVNKGTITGNGVVTNNGIIDNYGAMLKNTVLNKKTINGYAGQINNLENTQSGVIYIKSETIDVTTTTDSFGTIVFEGVENQHVSKIGGDKRVYRTAAATTFGDLYAVLSNIGANHIWTAYDIKLDNASKTAWYKYIAGIVVKGNVAFTGGAGKTYNFANATISVDNNCRLSIEDGITVMVLNRAKDAGQIHVGASSSFEIANVDHSTERPLVEGNVPSGAYILSSDFTVSSFIKVLAAEEVKINLNNKTLDLNGKTLEVLGNLTIINGTIKGDVVTSGNLVMESVKVTGSTTREALINIDADAASTVLKNTTIDGENARPITNVTGCGDITIEECNINHNASQSNAYLNPPAEGKKITVKNSKIKTQSLVCEIYGYEDRFSITGNTFGKSFSFTANGVKRSQLTAACKEFCNDVLTYNTFELSNKIAVTNNLPTAPANAGNNWFYVNVLFE